MNKITNFKTDWAAIDAMTDDEIDYSDSPELPEELIKLMKPREPEKIEVKLWLNQEIIDFFKKHNNKYKTRINDVLLAMVHDYEKAHSQ